MRIRTGARLRALVALLAATLMLGGLAFAPAEVGAQANPYQRGPAPTLAGLEQARGTFATATLTVPRQANFGGGTITYPTDTSQGTFGAVVVSPGFVSPQVPWAGPALASRGFVVFTIDTTTIFDNPTSRSQQLDAAITYLLASSVANRIDRTRIAAMGHSMGGGGTLELARNRPTLKAAVALQPWDILQSFGTVRVPTMIIGAGADFIAPVASFAEPFYTQVPAGTEKAYAEIAGADHLIGFTGNATQQRLAIAWLKRYVDNDTRYDQFLCPPPSGPTLAEYRNTCPTGS
jgi:dienelactone hydrolase